VSQRYEIIAPLAQGGQGEILLARRVGPAGFAKLVVLKKPKASLHSAALVAALIEEARLLAQINHSNVCQVHDLEEAAGEYFLALEYLEGLTAWDLIADAEDSATPLEPGAICGIIAQACDGLAAIHKLRGGVVHRDISPSNLFVTESGTIKILDLGIAKSADSEEHTPFGRVKGKLTYLSPEQVQGKPIDARSDLFALGLVLYDLAKGRRPARDRIGALAAIELDNVPAPLAAIVQHATAPDPTARYATAAEMGTALRAAGGALGSFYERGELADWLARRFATQLATRRERIRHEEQDTATATASRVLTMRSALQDDPTQLVSRDHNAQYTGGTERLPLPEHERLTSSAYFAAEQLRKRAPRPRRRTILVAAGIACAIGIAAIIALTSSTEPPRPAAAGMAQNDVPRPAGISPNDVPRPDGMSPNDVPRPDAMSPPTDPMASDRSRSGAPTDPSPANRPARSRHKAKVTVAAKALGLLTVDSNPYAVIKIDDKSIGTTPLYRVSLPAGRHRLSATDPAGRRQQQSITIEDGKEKRVRLDWSAQ
jgi:eukaryotic-like serine/threonine-protein kinase